MIPRMMPAEFKRRKRLCLAKQRHPSLKADRPRPLISRGCGTDYQNGRDLFPARGTSEMKNCGIMSAAGLSINFGRIWHSFNQSGQSGIRRKIETDGDGKTGGRAGGRAGGKEKARRKRVCA